MTESTKDILIFAIKLYLEEVDQVDKTLYKAAFHKLNDLIQTGNYGEPIGVKDLKIYYNKGPVVIQGLLFPIVLFFAFTIGRNIMPVFLISGLMAMTLFLTATSIGPVVFPWETRMRTLERLIACPISIKTILLGNIWSSFAFKYQQEVNIRSLEGYFMKSITSNSI